MADISKIKTNNVTYNIKDTAARNGLSYNGSVVTKSDGTIEYIKWFTNNVGNMEINGSQIKGNGQQELTQFHSVRSDYGYFTNLYVGSVDVANKFTSTDTEQAAQNEMIEALTEDANYNLLPLRLDKIKELNTSGRWTDNVYVANGITYTFTVNDGGCVEKITANGTAPTSFSAVTLAQYKLAAGSYIYSGCPSGGGTSRFYQDCRNDAGGQIIDTGSGNTIETAGQSGKIARIVILAGYAASNLEFYPIIKKAVYEELPFKAYAPDNTELQAEIDDLKSEISELRALVLENMGG